VGLGIVQFLAGVANGRDHLEKLEKHPPEMEVQFSAMGAE